MLATFTLEFLETKRSLVDPLADSLVQEIIQTGSEEAFNQAFMALVRNDGFSKASVAGLPAPVAKLVTDYFEETRLLPTWADPSLLSKGEKVFSTYGPEIFLLLNMASLPMCYTCAKGAKVLFDTGRLLERGSKIDPLVRRLMETAQMVVNAMQPEGLRGQGAGIVTIQKVRLIHASIRFFLKSPKYNPSGWDVAGLGEPINQEDLAGTLMSFSPIIVKGLLTMGIKLSEEEIASYTHCWKVIGYLMGIDEDLLTDSYADSRELAAQIIKHQAAASEQGKALTESCIAFMQYMLPGNIFHHVPDYMIWYFFQDMSTKLGLDLAGMIGVQDHQTLGDEFCMRLTHLFSGAIGQAEHYRIIQELTMKVNNTLLNAYIRHYNDNKQVQFFIPPSLKKDWKLD